MFEAVRRLLANVATPAGTLLLLDDLHWAGADAIELLASLLHQPPETPLRVVGAYRDTDVAPEHPLTVAIAELAEAQLVAQHALHPLTPQEAQALFVQLLGEREHEGTALAAQVAERAGGVPFFLVSYAHSLTGDDGSGLNVQGVPWDLRQSIERRVRALSETGRALLDVAAVIGRVAPRPLLLAVLEQPERVLPAALSGACRAGLLEEVGDDAYGFVHDVIREVVEADLGLVGRRRLHLQVALALERTPGKAPVEALAYHFRQAGEPARAAVYLERAGDLASALFAHAATAGHYQDLVACLEGLGHASALLRAREKLASALERMAQYDAALAVLDQVVDTLRAAGDMPGVSRVEARIAVVYREKGAMPAGIARLQPVLAALESGGPSTGLAEAYIALTKLFTTNGQADRGLATALRAVEIARAAGDRSLLATAQIYGAYPMLVLNRADEALQAIEEAVRLCDFSADWPALQAMAWIYEERGEYEQGRLAAARSLALAEQARDPSGIICAMNRLGVDAFLTGDWSGARVHLERAIAMARQIGITEGHNYATPRCDLGRLLHAEGAWDEAAHCFEEVLATFAGTGERTLTLVAHSHLAERDVLTGHPEAAQARLLPELDRPGLEERMVTQYILPVLAWAQFELGELDQAAATVAAAIERARSGTCRLGLVQALRVQALVQIARERWDEAARSLEEGLAVARGMPYPHGEGRLLHVYGLLHARQGEPARARERLDAALAIFTRLGARKDVERVERDRSGIGASIKYAARSGRSRDGHV
jgi:tetratricopeptide (TPR) repeat protein